jgi:sugar phosphate isomerase/epimerase
MSMQEWASLQERCGLDGLDLSVNFIKSRSPSYLSGIENIIRESGITPVMVTSYPDFTHPDKRQRQREVYYFAADIALCAQLNIPYLRVLAGQAHPETDVDEGVAWAIEGITESAGIADTLGVTLLYENHSKPGAWEYTDFSHPTEIFLTIAKGLDDTSVRINFDTCNTFAYGDDPLPVLERVIDKLETIHVADTAAKGEFRPVLVGTGQAPIKEIFSFAKSRGFDGWLCIEEASFSGVEGMVHAVHNTRDMWARS